MRLLLPENRPREIESSTFFTDNVIRVVEQTIITNTNNNNNNNNDELNDELEVAMTSSVTINLLLSVSIQHQNAKV
jgi:hypothetical protein